MYKRLILISIVILFCLCALGALGYHSISLQEEGLAGRRAAQFSAVAEQIRIDVKRKIDTFITAEENRDYTDYQYFYVPQASNNANVFVRSPLGDELEHGLAYGYFQIEPDGSIVTPFVAEDKDAKVKSQAASYIDNVKQNLFTVLKGDDSKAIADVANKIDLKDLDRTGFSFERKRDVRQYGEDFKKQTTSKDTARQKAMFIQQKALQQIDVGNTKEYSVKRSGSQETQYLNQQRLNVVSNRVVSQAGQQALQAEQTMMPGMMPGMPVQEETNLRRSRTANEGNDALSNAEMLSQQSADRDMSQSQQQALVQQDTVLIRIEPFVTVVTEDVDSTGSLFPGQIFLLRHVQIERDHFLQGFRLNEYKLLQEVEESATRLLRTAMSFEIGKSVDPKAAHAAILDSDFGEIILNLFELDPAWINSQITTLRNTYSAIVAVVFGVILITMISLFRSAHTQLMLAGKKDDFISAVSHELRTPLTSIRMYTEMLEKNWIKSEEKRNQYYRTMSQECERLSRLVENVLDFSRIQRGRKKYNFTVGNIDTCISDVVGMMAPAAQHAGFKLEKQLNSLGLESQELITAFDKDAVTQIVINLIDNSIKYAADADDKTIIVRTGSTGKYFVIEVEDHGPGIPNRQRKKVFDTFYRIGDESTRQTTGTGLGLALVRRFAEAHNGYVDILSAKPVGTVLRVGLAVSD